MGQLSRRTIARFAFWLALACGAALAVPFLYAVLFEGDGASLGGALLAAIWTGAPVYCAAAFVSASPDRTGAWSFLALQALLIATAVSQYIGSHESSTGALIFVFWPIAQWAAILLAFLVALALGWRMRPDFLRD